MIVMFFIYFSRSHKRHPREGGDPDRAMFESFQMAHRANVSAWIPAFAGKTSGLIKTLSHR
jgi:hypothetical protein